MKPNEPGIVKTDAVIQNFLSRIVPLRPLLKKVILFGSRARGKATPWSDYDFLIIVPQRERSLINALYDAVVQVQCDTGQDLSLKIVNEDEFKRQAALPTPFISNVLREGVVLG